MSLADFDDEQWVSLQSLLIETGGREAARVVSRWSRITRYAARSNLSHNALSEPSPLHSGSFRGSLGAMQQPPKLLDRLRAAIRVRHFSPRTEETYVAWAKRFIFFHGKRHPASMGAEEVNAFLSSLAVDGHVSASTQNQALSALLFLYRNVLDDPLPWINDIVRAPRPLRLPVVLTVDEVRDVLQNVSGPAHAVALLLYGSGLRLLEALTLRVKDVDFARQQITIRDPKGRRDRATPLPKTVVPLLHGHLVHARQLHQEDLSLGFGRVVLPTALDKKYRNAAVEWQWQWTFPAPSRWREKETGKESAITYTRASCNAPYTLLPFAQVSPNASAVTPSVTHSPLTCSSAATTSARFRNCSVTETSRRP